MTMAMETELPLFPPTLPTIDVRVETGDSALATLDFDVRAWEKLRGRAERSRTLRGEAPRLAELGRNLKALRDCYATSRHPKVRHALLVEAGAVTRRMRAIGNRMGLHGLAIRVLDPKANGGADARPRD